ncbi:hypothetical protein Tco_0046661, partial [Tanacetum coccineum]
HIKYVLTETPTIYVSLIHQFWETASASTSENGEMEITATINVRIKTVTEASIRRHLKLEDSDGIPTLPNAKNFEKLALMGDEGSLTLNELTVLCTTEKIVKQSKARRKTKIVVSDDEEVLEDPSKQGRIIAEIDQNPSISLLQNEGLHWIQEDGVDSGED